MNAPANVPTLTFYIILSPVLGSLTPGSTASRWEDPPTPPILYKTPEFPRPGSSIFLVRRPSQANWGKRPGSIGLLSPRHEHIPCSGPRSGWEDSAFSHCHWDLLFPQTPYIFACSLEVLIQGLSPLLG